MIVGEVEEARPWTDRDGNNRASLEVTALTVRFLSTKGEGGGGSYGPPTPTEAPPEYVGEEDIPF